MAKASRSVLALAAVASVSVAVLLLLAVELLAGFFVAPPGPGNIEGDAVTRSLAWLQIGPVPLVYDANLLWRNEPGARKTQLVNPVKYGRRDEWTLEINSEGMRGAERVAGAPGRKKFRILCVGDSVTFGFNVDQPDSYPEQLLRLFQLRYPGLEFEVINAGVPGWSWLQGLRYLDLHVETLDPDLIVIGHGTNDRFFPATIMDEERFLRLSSFAERAFQRFATFAAQTNTVRALSGLLPAFDRDAPSRACRKQIAATGSCRRVGLGQIADAVGEVAALGRRHQVPVLVANTDFMKTEAVSGVRLGVAAADVSYVDLVAELDQRRQKDEESRAIRLGLSLASPGVPATGTERGSHDIVLRVLVPDDSATYLVKGSAFARPDSDFVLDLRDDGTNGDEKPGDSVFSATLTISSEIAAVQYTYSQGDVLEFTPVPPFASALGDRLLHTPGSRIGPVEVFGQTLFMAERAHPNAEGHRLNARLLAEKIEELPAFRDYVRGAKRVDEAAAAPGS